MSNIKWHGDGIYSRTRKRGVARQGFYGRVWFPTERKFRHFKLGTTLPQAKRRMKRIEGDPEQALADRNRKHVKVLSFEALRKEFLAKYRSQDSSYYSDVTKALVEYLGETPVAGITVQKLDHFIMKRRDLKKKKHPEERRVSDATLRKEITALGTILRWAKRRGLVEANLVADYEKPKDPAGRTIAIIILEQEEALLGCAPQDLRDFIEWALYSGMRRGEIFKLRHEGIREGLIHTGSKTRKQARTVPLNVSARLGEILRRRPRRLGSDLVFYGRDGNSVPANTSDKALRRAWRMSGITKPRGGLWNVFRHTWATRLAATGRVSIFEISKWMGNSVTICERHYAAYLPSSLEKSAGLLDGMAAGVTLTVAPTVAQE